MLLTQPDMRSHKRTLWWDDYFQTVFKVWLQKLQFSIAGILSKTFSVCSYISITSKKGWEGSHPSCLNTGQNCLVNLNYLPSLITTGFSAFIQWDVFNQFLKTWTQVSLSVCPTDGSHCHRQILRAPCTAFFVWKASRIAAEFNSFIKAQNCGRRWTSQRITHYLLVTANSP